MCCPVGSQWSCFLISLQSGSSYFQFKGGYKLALIALIVLELLLSHFI